MFTAEIAIVPCIGKVFLLCIWKLLAVVTLVAAATLLVACRGTNEGISQAGQLFL